jgi:hypothetical protein
MFLDLEVCFLSALSLLLSNAIISDATESCFVEFAKSMLQEMSQAGNAPATALLHELDELGESIANLKIAITTHTKDSKTMITMIRDGQLLSEAIFNVIKLDDAQNQPLNLEPEDPNSASSMEQGHIEVHESSNVASTLSPEGMFSLSEEIFLHDYNSLENWVNYL